MHFTLLYYTCVYQPPNTPNKQSAAKVYQSYSKHYKTYSFPAVVAAGSSGGFFGPSVGYLHQYLYLKKYMEQVFARVPHLVHIRVWLNTNDSSSGSLTLSPSTLNLRHRDPTACKSTGCYSDILQLPYQSKRSTPLSQAALPCPKQPTIPLQLSRAAAPSQAEVAF